MNFFKKAAAIVLGLTMSVSLFACGGENDDSSSKPNGGTFPESNLQEGEGAKYLEGAVEAFKEAETVTIEFKYDMDCSTTTKSPYMADEETETTNMEISAKYVLAKTDNGYNMSMEGKATDPDDGEVEEAKVYIIDGYVYEYNEYDKVWTKEAWDSAIEYDAEAWTMLSEIYNAITAEDADLTAVYEALGPVLEQFAYIENNTYNFELDVKDEAIEALDYLANLDYTQTVEAYLNGVLEDCGSDKTVKGILDEVASYGSYTVGEAYADLNEILVEETGKNVNGLKNELVAKVEALDTSLFEEYLSAEDIEAFNAIVTQIKDADVDALVKSYADVTMDDLVVMLFAAQNGNVELYTAAPAETITLKTITDMIYSGVQTMTLQEVVYSMGIREIMDVSKQAKYVTVSDLSEKLAVKFNGYKFSSLAYEAKVGGSYDNSADTAATVKNSANLSVSCGYKIEFSKTKTTITAPEGAVDVNDPTAVSACEECGSTDGVEAYDEWDGTLLCAACAAQRYLEELM